MSDIEAMSEKEEETITFMPTLAQQEIISLLFVVTSLLSVIGSFLIILNVKKDKKKTPFRRLLLALSAFHADLHCHFPSIRKVLRNSLRLSTNKAHVMR